MQETTASKSSGLDPSRSSTSRGAGSNACTVDAVLFGIGYVRAGDRCPSVTEAGFRALAYVRMMESAAAGSSSSFIDAGLGRPHGLRRELPPAAAARQIFPCLSHA